MIDVRGCIVLLRFHVQSCLRTRAIPELAHSLLVSIIRVQKQEVLVHVHSEQI